MRASWWFLVLLLFTLTLPAAGAPPLPEGIEPAPWDPPEDLGKLLREIQMIEDQTEMDAYLERIERTLMLNPGWIDLHRHYISLNARSDRFPEVQAEYREDADQNREDPDALFLAGQAARDRSSAGYYQDALDLKPDHYYALTALGLTMAAGPAADRDIGFEHLFEALQLRPDHPYIYQALALAYARGVKDYEAAVEACRLWQKVEPDAISPVQLESSYLAQLGRPVESLERLESFAEKYPKDRSALRALASAYTRAQRGEEATKIQVQLADLAKRSPNEAYRAAALFAQQGERERTIHWLKEAGKRGFFDSEKVLSEPGFRAYRDDPGFNDAIETMADAFEKKLPELKAGVLKEMIRKEAPGFTIQTLSGKDVSLEELRGKVVVLDFWATWCKPCQMTLPLLQKLEGTMNDRPVEILCMNVWERDKGRAKVAPYWKSSNFTMEVGLGSQQDAANYGVTGIPALFVIDQEGQIRYQHRGYSSYMDREIAWIIEELLGNTDQGVILEDR